MTLTTKNILSELEPLQNSLSPEVWSALPHDVLQDYGNMYRKNNDLNEFEKYKENIIQEFGIAYHEIPMWELTITHSSQLIIIHRKFGYSRREDGVYDNMRLPEEPKYEGLHSPYAYSYCNGITDKCKNYYKYTCTDCGKTFNTFMCLHCK